MKHLTETPKTDKFIFFPTNQLFSIIDNPADAEQALRALAAVGFADDTQLFHGEEGVHRIDANGAGHGWLAQLRRLRQSVSLDGQHAALYEEAVRQGHCVIAVHSTDAERREEARQILKAHGGHFVNFYGRFTIQKLDL